MNTLQSIFPLLTGVGIKEYIRKRRLSLAVNDIMSGLKVIDIAFKYGYESPISFSRAFFTFHGIKLSQVKKTNHYFLIFPKIELEEKLLSASLEYRIVKDYAFQLYGVSKKVDINRVEDYTPSFWKEVKKNNHIFLESKKRFGFLIEEEQKYYCCLEKQFSESTYVSLSKMNYIVFKMNSFEAKDIIDRITFDSEKYLKYLKLSQEMTPFIEVYYKDYLEIWIPTN